MATNRDLLKEAIADAKAVKETAIANAKAALEESFTPFLREKLSQKINEMDELSEEEMEEMMPAEAEKSMYEEESELEEISLDELLAELDDSPMEEELYEAKEKEEETEEEETEDEEMSIEDMSEDDLKSFIEDVIQDMISAGELEAGHEGMENEEGAEEEEISMEEILAEIEEAKKKKKQEEETESLDEDLLNEMASFYKIKDDVNQENAKKAIEIVRDRVTNKGTSLYALLDTLANTGEVDLKQLAKETGKDIATWNNPKTRGYLEKEGILAKYLDAGSSPSAKRTGRPKGSSDLEDLDLPPTNESLYEAYKAIKTLQSELQEVNLLNAKLLYTNKIFRNKSLNESQKIKVLTMFDKAKTKKEAQLVYETLQESLKTTNTTKAPIRESLSSASKMLGGASTKPIIENTAFARMRELAGLKK
jgi:hypothetical protein